MRTLNFSPYVRTLASRRASFAHRFAVLQRFKTNMAAPQTTDLSDAFAKLKIDDEDHELVESLVQLAAKKPKLVKFLLKKLNQVGKTREDLIYMPMGDDGKSLR